MKPTYKTSRKYKCPYCNHSATRGELVEHVDKQHHDLIPEDYTSARSVYDSINGKNYGICMICKKPVYEWNDKINRYRNLCNDPKCKAKVREIALERHLRVYNKPTLLNDSDQQEKMLANRRISGTYIFSDGTKMTYTGKYERNALEFMDKVLNIPAKDIQTPGPVLEYEYNGEIHKWITDIYYIPANLLIEVKDGGSNPNNRSMTSYREKQIAKETMITNLGTFNYLRLTNNNFAQLLDVLADIKSATLEEDKNKRVHINEEVGGLPRNGPPEAYIIPYGMNNAFTGSAGLAYGNSEMDKLITIDDDNNIIPIDKLQFESMYGKPSMILYATEGDIRSKIDKTYNIIESGSIDNNKFIFAEIFADRKINRWQDILLSSNFRYYDKIREDRICSFIENAVAIDADQNKISNVISTKGNVKICKSQNGFYAYTSGSFNMASEHFQDLHDLEASGIIDIMQDIYDKNGGKNNDIG